MDENEKMTAESSEKRGEQIGEALEAERAAQAAEAE